MSTKIKVPKNQVKPKYTTNNFQTSKLPKQEHKPN